MTRLPSLAIALAFLLLSAAASSAQTRIFIPCPSGIPCSTNVNGHIDAVGTARLPWVASVAVPANVCLKVSRNSSDTGVIKSVIAPNGTVYRLPADSFLTYVIAVSPTIAGWYTIQLDTPPPGREQIFDFLLQLDSTGECGSGTSGK